ncbi:MAG TPA: radical SAM protein, partial [Thermoanaerobaculia bacterium]
MRVCFTHLGCKLNQAEVERLARQFAAAGHRVVDDLADADLHVVNSCTVTSLAARSSRQAATRGRERSGLRTVLTGCYASEPGGAPALPGVDLVVANRDKERLVELVHAAFPEAAPLPSAPVVPSACRAAGTRALLKVEDGCNMRCAFCVIPSTRGRQHSRPLPELVAELQSLWAAGYREVVVTGVQISAYRDGTARLPELVRALLATLDGTNAPRRLRLTSIAPWDLEPGWLALWQDRRLCRHLHLSLQS